jgi:hypothetical protein
MDGHLIRIPRGKEVICTSKNQVLLDIDVEGLCEMVQ